MGYSIRPVSASDGRELNRLKTMAGVYETTLNNPTETVEETIYWIENKAASDYYFVCELKTQPKLIGYVILEISSNPRIAHVANLRIAVDSNYQNQKIGSKLLTFALDYADYHLMIKKVELSVIATNHSVINWYQKNGFTEEGLRKGCLFLGDNYVDTLLMSRFNTNEMRGNFMTKMKTIKQDVLRIAKKIYQEGLVAGTSGNVSIYQPELATMVITPSNIDYELMEIEDLMLIDLEGNVLEGKHKPSSEWNLHATIYKNRPDVLSVIHTHSPRATSFAVIKEVIPVVLVEMLPFLRGDIPLAKFAYPGTAEVGLNAVAKLKNRNACLLENHGVVAIGGNVDQTYLRAVYVEDAAKIYHFARQIGEPKPLSEEALETLRKRYNIKKDE